MWLFRWLWLGGERTHRLNGSCFDILYEALCHTTIVWFAFMGRITKKISGTHWKITSQSGLGIFLNPLIKFLSADRGHSYRSQKTWKIPNDNKEASVKHVYDLQPHTPHYLSTLIVHAPVKAILVYKITWQWSIIFIDSNQIKSKVATECSICPSSTWHWQNFKLELVSDHVNNNLPIGFMEKSIYSPRILWVHAWDNQVQRCRHVIGLGWNKIKTISIHLHNNEIKYNYIVTTTERWCTA